MPLEASSGNREQGTGMGFDSRILVPCFVCLFSRRVRREQSAQRRERGENSFLLHRVLPLQSRRVASRLLNSTIFLPVSPISLMNQEPIPMTPIRLSATIALALLVARAA